MPVKWIENEKERARFWARAHELGFDHDTVHVILNVTSLKEYKGTEAEAIATLTKKAAEVAALPDPVPAPDAPPDAPAADNDDLAAAYTVTCRDLPESPALAFTKFQTPGGFVWSVTVRAGLPELLETQALKSIARQIKLFEAGALANDWLPISDGRDMAMGLKPRAEAAPVSAPQNGGSKPTAQPTQAAQGGNGALTFKVESLDMTSSNGKVSWKVKGGPYKQWGVTLWPEVVVAAGLNPDNLKIEDIAGWSATYILSEENKPKKIVKLEAAQ